VSATEFEAIDPLGGILHPNWENRKRQEEAEAKQFILRRYFKRLVEWVKLDEPNLTTGDTRLDVDPGEVENLPPLSEDQDENLNRLVAAFDGVGPAKTDFYDDFLSPKVRQQSPPNAEQ